MTDIDRRYHLELELAERVAACETGEALRALWDTLVEQSRRYDSPYKDIKVTTVFGAHTRVLEAWVLRTFQSAPDALIGNPHLTPVSGRLLVHRVATHALTTTAHDTQINHLIRTLHGLARRRMLLLDQVTIDHLYAGCTATDREMRTSVLSQALPLIDLLQDALVRGDAMATIADTVIRRDVEAHDSAFGPYPDQAGREIALSPQLTPEMLLALHDQLPSPLLLETLGLQSPAGRRVLADSRVRAIYRAAMPTHARAALALLLSPDEEDFVEAYQAAGLTTVGAESQWKPDGAPLECLALLPPALIAPWCSHASKEIRLRAVLALGGRAEAHPVAPRAARGARSRAVDR
jgi:hypothetical protein